MTAKAILVVVEDQVSEAVIRRLIAVSGKNLVIDRVVVTGGNGPLKAGIERFVAASHALPHIVLTDLDSSLCAPALLRGWRADCLPPRVLLRVAVREVEAWLMADRWGIAGFLAVPVVKVPANPEADPDPKQTLVGLARKSRKRRVAQELAPQAGSSNRVGPLYNARLVEFAARVWDVERARELAPSLDRTMQRLSGFLMA